MFKRSLLTFVALGSLVYAQEEFDPLDAFDDAGFDEVEVTKTPPQKKVQEKQWSFNGNVALKTTYAYQEHSVNNIDYNTLTQAQASLFLQFDYKLPKKFKLRISGDGFYDGIYDARDSKFSDAIEDAYKKELRLGDTYIEGAISENIDIKVGRQIVIWGKSDSIRVTDVLNPLDNRNPGLTDIEDLRLPVGMIKSDYYVGDWDLSAMVIMESRVAEERPLASEFFPLILPLKDIEQPDSSVDNFSYALSANGEFSGWDLSFYAATNILDQRWYIKDRTKRVVGRIDMAGSALNIAYGSWLVKSEIAYLHSLEYTATQDKKDRLDTLIGFDYMGIKDTILSLEIASRYIFDYETQMLSKDSVEENEIQTALRYSQSFLHDTLDFTALVSMFGASWENGGFSRVWFEYDIADALSSNIGVVDYMGGDKTLMEKVKNNDRVFADIKYSF